MKVILGFSTVLQGRAVPAKFFMTSLSLFWLALVAQAQTIRVDTTPARAVRFDPDQALGTSMDILPANQVDKVYSDSILKESLSAGWGPITYRQNT